jgi:hypothetical protein
VLDPVAELSFESLVALEQKIHQAVRWDDFAQLGGDSPRSHKRMLVDLHRLASLLYASRAVHQSTGEEIRHQSLVRASISLLTRMKTCQSAWPLFIVACEASSEEQRLQVLEVFEQSRHERRRRFNHIQFIQHMVETVWKQHDLGTESRVDYLTVFDTVIGSVPFLPLFT